jgi:hypothetical protein
MFFLFDLKVFHLSLGLNLNIQTNFEKFQISKCFKKFILIYPNLTSVQIQFKSISNLRFLNLKSCLKFKKKERVYATASLAFSPFRRSAHFHLSFTPTETARSARPSGPVQRLPPPASISTAAPLAMPPCRAPLTTALLRARRAKLMRRHAAFTSPTESAPSCLLFPL